MIKENINPEQLLQMASEVALNAYSPYSDFRVGACVLFADGSMYKGCNVESASYGLTLCAERNALSTAIAHGQKKDLLAVAIYSPDAKLCYPCGACRQWISELSQDSAVIVENEEGKPMIHTISDLLPHSFKL